MTEQSAIRVGAVTADIRRVREVPKPPMYADAVQVTEQNKAAVLAWIGHEWMGPAMHPGDWIVTNAAGGHEVVIDRAFTKLYDFVDIPKQLTRPVVPKQGWGNGGA